MLVLWFMGSFYINAWPFFLELGRYTVTDIRGTLHWPIRRNAVTMQAKEHLESSDFNHRLLAIGHTRNFSNF